MVCELRLVCVHVPSVMLINNPNQLADRIRSQIYDHATFFLQLIWLGSTPSRRKGGAQIVTETFQYVVATTVHIVLYTVKLTKTKKIILNLGPKFPIAGIKFEKL